VSASSGRAAREPSPDVRRALTPLLEHPGDTAIVTDFDGTLAPIVDDPGEARAVDGAADVMAQLADRFGVVAVVSGRPVSFLWERLVARAGAHPTKLVGLYGLYGLEWSGSDGVVHYQPGVERWRPVVDEAVGRLGALTRFGARVEPKGLTLAVHWREAPEAARPAAAAVDAEVARSGLRAHPGRMSIELGPPLDIDKGSTLRGLVAGCSAACYFGDDLGDLPAFAALADLADAKGMATVAVAVTDAESAPEVAEAADIAVPGPLEALRALRWLAQGGSAGWGA
jgi:trehalose 6-phosphate phosphatase